MKSRIIKTEIITNFIEKNNLSKTGFCKMIKIAPSTFNKIMNNSTNYGIVALFKIAKAMNSNIWEILC